MSVKVQNTAIKTLTYIKLLKITLHSKIEVYNIEVLHRLHTEVKKVTYRLVRRTPQTTTNDPPKFKILPSV